MYGIIIKTVMFTAIVLARESATALKAVLPPDLVAVTLVVFSVVIDTIVIIFSVIGIHGQRVSNCTCSPTRVINE
jgi:hypothetical protein